MICGLLSLFLFFTVFPAAILATVAIVLAAVHLFSKNRAIGRNLSIAGIIFAVLALAVAGVFASWVVDKTKQATDNVADIKDAISEVTGNASVIADTIEQLPGDNEEAATIAKNLNTPIESLEHLDTLDIGSLLGTLSNPDDPANASNYNALVEQISNEETLKELEKLGLEGLGSTLENFGAQFRELNELLAE